MAGETMQTSEVPDRIAFGPFRLRPRERLLTRDGVPVEIGGRSLDLLVALIEQAGRVVQKRDLLKRVWPDVIVEDGSLRFHVAGLRKALGDGQNGARYIATQVGVGYAFVAEVVVPPEAPEERPAPMAAPAAEPPAPGSGNVRGLPARLLQIVGRESNMVLLAERLADTRLFTIVGPGGVGKTSLAIEVAHRLVPDFGGSVCFIDLGTVADPHLIPSAIAEALDIPLHADDPMSVVLGHIRTRKLLLILDNCEHLVAAVARVVERLAEAGPGIRILATSREPLRARDEHLHWLGALDYPNGVEGLAVGEILDFPAVALFVARATAGNSAFAVDAEAARTIAEMCHRLDGMALPIELAAGRAATHGLAATAALLGDRFSLDWTGRRTALPRQQTLQATLDWSYALLTDAERHALDRLSVFVGPFSFEAAIDVLTDQVVPAEVATAALEELTAKSLVTPDRMSSDPAAYRLLEMTRAYAAGKLAARGAEERTATAGRHARYFLRKLQAFDALRESVGTDRLSRALGNIRAALEWSFGPDGDPAVAVPLAAGSSAIFLNLSLLAECRSWCERALRQLPVREQGTPSELELQAALGLSLMFTRGSSDATAAALHRALDIAIALDDRWNQLRLLGRLPILHERTGDYAAAAVWSRRAVEVADAIGEPEAIAVAASISGITYHLSGDQQRARPALELCLRQALPSARARTIHYGFDHRNRAAIGLSRVLWLLGEPDRATALAAETAETASRLDHPVTHCIALLGAFWVHDATGDLEKAERTLALFTEQAEVNALGPYIAATPGLQAMLAIRQGRPEGAIARIEESLARLRAARYAMLTLLLENALIAGLSGSARSREGLDLMSAMIDRCAANGELFSMPELLRTKAELLRACDGTEAEVEALLVGSLDLARRQGARAWELRTATDLARLWQAEGRAGEAVALLRPVRAGFTEGLRSADLRAADELLAGLGG